MTDHREVSLKRKIWEILNPLLFLFVCMLAGTAAVYGVIVVVCIMKGSVSGEIFRLLNSSVLWCDFVFYTAVLIGKRKTVVIDKIKYGHGSKNLIFAKCALSVFLIVVYAFAVNWLMLLSGIDEYFTTYNEAVQVSFSGQNAFVLIIVVVFLGPIAEEIIFRYLLYGRIRYYMGRRWAVILSSVAFGLYHGNMVQFVYCTLLGIALSCSYEKSGNLKIPAIAHMIINFVGIIGYI